MLYSELEERVFSLIKGILSSDERVVEEKWEDIPWFRYFRPDLYLPNGCKELDFPKETIIEIKTRLLFDSLSRCHEIFDKLKKDGFKGKFVVVTNQESLAPFERDLESEKFQVCSIEDIEGKIKASKRESNVYERSKKEGIFDLNAENVYKPKNITIFLGAGVSRSAGLPTWENLILNMFKFKMKGNENLCFLDLKRSCWSSSLIEARYLNAYGGKENKKELELVAKAMYGSGQKGGNLKAESPLLTALCDFINKYRDKLESVITYNFDDFLEQSLKNKRLSEYRSIYKGTIPDSGKIPIYHVHGFIPQSFLDNGENASEIIFDEAKYHELYEDPYNWANIEQLHALSRNTCFFIGLSMSDPNLRRLLEISGKRSDGKPHHFAFLKQRENNKDQEIQKKIFNDLGVNVVWYAKHDELPGLIHSIVEKGVVKWEK